jgi:LPXTG-motif cell wall-anchored protein
MSIQVRRFLAFAMFLIVTAGISSVATAQTETTQSNTAKIEGQTNTSQIDISKGPGKGEVKVKVSPEEAYIWVNGVPVAHRNSTLYLAPGEYTITVANYGFKPQTQKVTVAPDQSQQIEALLKPAGHRVSGPWGRVQIEGVSGKSPVFVNGTTPEFFVGHVDEMNNDIMTTEQLILPVGKFQLYVMNRGTNQPIWSGTVEVKPSERLIVYLEGETEKQARMVYKGWPEASKIKDLQRFEAGTASATIAVAPVSASLTTDRSNIKCNEPARLTWSAENAPQATLTADNQTIGHGASGKLQVSPKQTTKYQLRAVGPGGDVTKEVTITVDPTVQTSLSASPQEVRFVKVGDTLKEQGSANLAWKASNADSVQIESVGTLSGNSGAKSVKPVPTKSGAGPVDEMLTYRIVAKNVCGGSDSSTASVHVTGSIEAPVVAEATPPQLPQTASPLPLLALLGLASLGAGAVVRMRRR